MSKQSQAHPPVDVAPAGPDLTLQRFLDAAATGLVRCTADLRYVSVNATFARLIGRPVEAIVGRTLEEVLGRPVVDAIRPYLERVLRGERVEYEIELTLPGVGSQWIHATYVPDLNEAGVVVGWIASVLDVSERKRAEAAAAAQAQMLRDREQLQRMLLQVSDLGAHQIDSNVLMASVGTLVANELAVSRCGFDLVNVDKDEIVVVNDFHGTLPPAAGVHPFHEYADEWLHEAASSRPVAFDDVASDPRTAARYASTFAPMYVRAYLTVPLRRNGKWVANFWVSHHEPRRWTRTEVELLQLIAERVWSSVERARAEEALRRSQDHLQFVTDHAPVLLVHCDRNARYTFVNTPYSARFGRRPQDLIGSHISDIVGERAYEALRPHVERALAGERDEFELAIEYPYGLRRMYSTYVPQRDATGAVTGFVAVVQDVTSRREAEETLRATDARFRATFENAAVGIAHVGPDGRWLRVNDRLCEIVGYPRDQVLQLTFQDITHPDDLETDLRYAGEVMEGTRASYSMDKRYIRGDGAIIWVTLTVALARDRDGKPDYFISIVEDITARKAAESALVEADRRKDEFLAMLAHELRNPLAPIRTSMALMRTRPSTDSLILKCRDVIDRQATHMARLLDDLLDVSRFSRGKLTLRRKPVVLRDAIDAAIEVNGSMMMQRGQRIVVCDEAAPLVVDGDDARLVQVFGNLINNAAKYSDAGAEIRISLVCDGDSAVVAVRDEGIGIAPEMLGRIFELFTQAEAAREYAPGGMGIGLSLAERLVTLHGGQIVAASAGIGSGAEFTVRLPLIREAVMPVDPAPARRRRSTASRRRVLVIDDNIDVADTHAMLLSEEGCEVRTVYSGAAGVREAEQFRPDLVLLDIGLPDLSGYDVCRRLRAMDSGSRMSIVAVTGWGQEYDRQQSAAAGFDRHLVKPVDPAVLSELVVRKGD
jgi:PAS domain S-box-containing protein